MVPIGTYAVSSVAPSLYSRFQTKAYTSNIGLLVMAFGAIYGGQVLV